MSQTTQQSIIVDNRLKLLISAMITLSTCGKWNEFIDSFDGQILGEKQGATDTFEWTAIVNWKCGTEKKLLPTKLLLSMEYEGHIPNGAPMSGRGIENFIARFADIDDLDNGQTLVPGEAVKLSKRWGFDKKVHVTAVASIVCTALEDSTTT